MAIHVGGRGRGTCGLQIRPNNDLRAPSRAMLPPAYVGSRTLAWRPNIDGLGVTCLSNGLSPCATRLPWR
jgi:hypothetical protein